MIIQQSDVWQSRKICHMTFHYYKLQIHTLQFFLFFYPEEPYYGILLTICERLLAVYFAD